MAARRRSRQQDGNCDGVARAADGDDTSAVRARAFGLGDSGGKGEGTKEMAWKQEVGRGCESEGKGEAIKQGEGVFMLTQPL